MFSWLSKLTCSVVAKAVDKDFRLDEGMRW